MVGGRPALCNALFPTEGAAVAVGVVAVVASGSVVAGVDVVVAAAERWRAWRGCGPSRRRAAFSRAAQYVRRWSVCSAAARRSGPVQLC